MTQTLQLPLWVRFEPVLRFDAEGLLALAVPYRSEGFAEDLDDLPVPRSSTTETRRVRRCCPPPRKGGGDRSMNVAEPAAARVLVVDDEPELRSLLAEYFGRQGFAVRGGGRRRRSARALVAQEAPALAILDINMPGENGLSLARWLREAHPRVGIVMLTTASETVDRIVGLELGADDYVPKPFEMRELLARVRARAAPHRPAAGGRRRPSPPRPAADAVASRRVAFGACLLDLDQRRLLGADGTDIDDQRRRVRPAGAVRPPSEPAAEPRPDHGAGAQPRLGRVRPLDRPARSCGCAARSSATPTSRR